MPKTAVKKQGFLVPPGKVVIAPEVAPDVSQGGIHIPEQAKEKARSGHIVAADVAAEESIFKPGRRCIFGAYSGMEFMGDDGATYIAMDQEDVLVVLQ